jgi:hypothetical protein
VVIKTNRSDKTEIKKILKISGHQQRWPRPLPGAILIPPALLVVADFLSHFYSFFWAQGFGKKNSVKSQVYGHQLSGEFSSPQAGTEGSLVITRQLTAGAV